MLTEAPLDEIAPVFARGTVAVMAVPKVVESEVETVAGLTVAAAAAAAAALVPITTYDTV